MRYIVSGGGTGGHIFPALAIAKAIAKADKDARILFVGAENRMEMELVPAEGFDIVGLPVAGFSRSNPLKNFKVLLKLYKSMKKARKIIADFQPDVAVGVGGYASGPILKAAQKKGIPTVIQEQNSYAGVTNKLLAKKADRICVAYDNMDKFFPAEKITKTGNPLRPEIKNAGTIDSAEAKKKLGFNPNKPLVVALGGSLGARSVNEAMKASVKSILDKGGQVLWQTGKRFYDEYKDLDFGAPDGQVQIVPFVKGMDNLYAATDLLISRAGASTISEIQYLGIPAVLIPSPNVAEDHQRKNAEALSGFGAAVTVLDAEAVEKLPQTIADLLDDKQRMLEISKKVKAMGIGTADEKIADLVIKLGNRN